MTILRMQKASRAAEERARLEGEGRGEMHCKAGAVTLKFGCVRDEETRETAVIRLAGRQRAGLGQTRAHLGRDVVGVCGVTENVNDGANGVLDMSLLAPFFGLPSRSANKTSCEHRRCHQIPSLFLGHSFGSQYLHKRIKSPYMYLNDKNSKYPAE